MMRTVWKIVLPLLVIALAVLGAGAMILSRKPPETRIPETPRPLVRVQVIELENLTLRVTSQGTVTPRTESVLIAEVMGQVIEASPSFIEGGFFDEGDALLRIDPFDYEQALVRARADVTRAELRLAQERAEADVARREWEDLREDTDATDLTLRVPQIADARASVEAAKAAVNRAERDLERTVIRAPYTGRVRERKVDFGQFVNRGTPLATIYAIDSALVRLPLPDDDLAFIDLPLVFRGDSVNERGPRVKLRARFAGRVHEWDGRIVRTEGVIDPQSRMVHAVARVRDPYGRGTPERPPLAAGLFVDAEIEGVEVRDVAVVPRTAVRDGNQVLVVDTDDRLRFRPVEVLRTEASDAIIRTGLESGDRVCLSVLAAVTDGMQVRVMSDDDANVGDPS